VPRLKDLDASVSVEGKLEKLAAVESRQLAAAHGAISMVLKNLRESPEQLLAAYEQSFDVPADRRAIESEIPMESAVG
jgi:hypothetical protein